MTQNHRVWEGSDGLINGIQLLEATIKGKGKSLHDATAMTDALEFILKLNKLDFQNRLDVTLHLKDSSGEKLFSFSSAILELIENDKSVCYKCIIPSNFFNVGKFSLDLFIVEDRKSVLYMEQDFLDFTINNKPIEIGQYMGNEPGALHPHFNWSTEKLLQ
jgi:lipopolysaccharide transport system ATP-binding protein